MASDDLVRLARRVRASDLGKDDETSLASADFIEAISKLPIGSQSEIRGLMEEIRSLVPTDFAFWLFFEFAGVRLSMEFQDGNTGATAGGGFFTSRKSMRNKLRRIDWDSRRTELLKRGDIFDEMIRAADDRPANIPSSEAAANRYHEELATVFADVRERNPRPEYALIIARDDLGIAVEELKERRDVVFTIADRMTTQNDILAVLEQGVAWPFSEIEVAKREAVEELGPISRAKAERRFGV